MAFIKNQNIKQVTIGSIFMIVVLTLMVFLSEITEEKEIIFPEVAALCVGSFLLPHIMWKSSYLKMILYIALCASLGVLIVKFLLIPLWIQFTIGFILAQLIFFVSGTGLAPMISAMVLPILIQTESPIYIVSAILLTALVVLFTILHSKFVLRERKETKIVKIPLKEFIPSSIFRVLLSTIVVFLCTHFNLKYKFCVAPPLLVAFTEMTTNKHAPGLKRPATTIFLFTLCALIGAASRYLVTSILKWKIPLTFSTIITTVGIIVLMKGIRLPFAPAAAMGILAMLIPKDIVLIYPLEVAAGISIWTIGALFWKNVLWGKEEKGKDEPTINNKTKKTNHDIINKNNSSESTIEVREDEVKEESVISIEIETIDSDTNSEQKSISKVNNNDNDNENSINKNIENIEKEQNNSKNDSNNNSE